LGTQRVREYKEPEEIKKQEVKKEKEEAPTPTHIEKSSRPPKSRGKKWQGTSSMIEKGKLYPLSEAIELAKRTSYSKFDGKIEVHIKLNPKKGQVIRGSLVLPHGAGKEPKVAIFNPDLLSQIQKGKIDFDILLARPKDMPILAKVAKILGPRGLMPNPKSGTVSEHPEEVAEKIKSGLIEFKGDPQNNIHQIIGRVSWETKRLDENFQALYNAVRPYNPESVTICATMGPGIRVKV